MEVSFVDRRLSIKLVKDGLFTSPAAAKTPLTIKLAPSPHFAMGQMGFTSWIDARAEERPFRSLLSHHLTAGSSVLEAQVYLIA